MSKDRMTRALETALALRERNPATSPPTDDGRMADDVLHYCTIDPVNLEFVRDLAEPFGLAVDHREPRDGPVPGPAVLIDGDNWWFGRAEREEGLARLVAQEGRAVIAVHSWHLDEEQIAWLAANGIHSSNRLDRDLIARIATDLAGTTIRSIEPIRVR